MIYNVYDEERFQDVKMRTRNKLQIGELMINYNWSGSGRRLGWIHRRHLNGKLFSFVFSSQFGVLLRTQIIQYSHFTFKFS